MKRLFLLLIPSICIIACSPKQSKDEINVSSKSQDTLIVEENPEKKLSDYWEYRSIMDEMRDIKNDFAVIHSDYDEVDNSVRGKLIISVRKKPGQEIVMLTSTGHAFYDTGYKDEDYVNVRFNNDPLIKYFFSEPETDDDNLVFIDKSKDFISHLKTADSIKIEVNLFNSGKQVYKFHPKERLVW